MMSFSSQVKADRSHALRGNASRDAPRPCGDDAERHWLHSHAERGNDQGRGLVSVVGSGMLLGQMRFAVKQFFSRRLPLS